jgi:hemerythrin-like metal-binding protein
MKWAEGCSAGLPDLDEQHKLLFERLVFVKETVARGGDWNDTHAALATLITRFEICTAVEEALMQIHRYPECGPHLKEHADLLLHYHAMRKASLGTGLTEKMIGTAFAATMKHHLTQDRRYARYLPQGRARIEPGPV